MGFSITKRLPASLIARQLASRPGWPETWIMYGKRDNDYRPRGPIHTEKIITDRKVFFLDLKENDRGRFVKITEDVRGRRDTIMVPSENLDEFLEALKVIQQVAQDAE